MMHKVINIKANGQTISQMAKENNNGNKEPNIKGIL